MKSQWHSGLATHCITLASINGVLGKPATDGIRLGENYKQDKVKYGHYCCGRHKDPSKNAVPDVTEPVFMSILR